MKKENEQFFPITLKSANSIIISLSTEGENTMTSLRILEIEIYTDIGTIGFTGYDEEIIEDLKKVAKSFSDLAERIERNDI